jgi:hypothetical protein
MPSCAAFSIANSPNRSPKGVKRDRSTEAFNLFSPPAPPSQKRK